MRKYDIWPEDCENTDEKWFLVGRIHKAKRVFNEDVESSGRLLKAGQDGS